MYDRLLSGTMVTWGLLTNIYSLFKDVGRHMTTINE
jgi:hypothetical protein